MFSLANLMINQLIISFISGYHHSLFRWKEHLRRANRSRLLNYTYVINVCSGHQPICPDESKCDILCDVNAITRCIEVSTTLKRYIWSMCWTKIYQSRIIDGEYFPRTLSAGDTILLKLLREIIDVKYLQTPQFAGQVLLSESVFVLFLLIKQTFFVGLILESKTGILLTDCR